MAGSGTSHAQGLAEFVLLLALLAIVAAGAILFLGGGLDTIMGTMSTTASPSARP